jgi:hypothetical protein
MSALDRIRTRPKLWASAAILTAGVASGVVLGTTVTAGASTPSTTTTPSSSSGSSAPPWNTNGPGLPKSGTVTAVGADSVTIDGTTYAVTSSSDIDKNGEATLSDLKVGDKVTFSTVASASTPTIDKLHAGSEALDRPSGGPGGSRPDKPGAPPSGSSPSA